MNKSEFIERVCNKHYPQPERGSEHISETNGRCGLKLLMEKWIDTVPVPAIEMAKIVALSYPDDIPDFFSERKRLIDNVIEVQKADSTPSNNGDLPLHESHMCYKDGHAMKPVYSFQHEKLAHGNNKCYRCGWEEEWQYDF